MNTGRWPEPPPVAIPTLPATGASARTMARGDGRRSWSPWAARMPSSISSTNGSGSLRIFCTAAALPAGPARPGERTLRREAERLDDLLFLGDAGPCRVDELDE